MPKRSQCLSCGELVFVSRSSSADGPVCRPCRRQRRCGSPNGYRKGCRCDPCTEAKAAEMRRYAARRLAEGVNIYRENRSRPTRSNWIKPSERRKIYERDDWVCQICFDSVDPSLPSSHRMAATLDHIKPQSLELFPDHSPGNLRLAHRSCNSRRGAPQAAA